jgi:hypothetical protein
VTWFFQDFFHPGSEDAARWSNQGVSPQAAASDPAGSPWRPIYKIPGEPAGSPATGQ